MMTAGEWAELGLAVVAIIAGMVWVTRGWNKRKDKR